VKLNMDRLARGEYTLAELEEKKEETIGEYEGQPVVVAKGPFGEYIQYRGENIGVSALATSSTEDSLYDKFVEYMKQKSAPTTEQTNSKIIRELAEGLSIRNGKYGGYIHHQTDDMKKPKFYTLKGFKESYRLCQKDVLLEWIRTTYQIG